MNPKVVKSLEELLKDANKLPTEKPEETNYSEYHTFNRAWSNLSGLMQTQFGPGWRSLEQSIEKLGYEGRKKRIISYIQTMLDSYTQPI